MSEVDKLFELTGIKPEYDYFTAIKYDFPKIVQYFHFNKKELVDKIVNKIKYCKKNILIKVIRVDKDYPDFTAEKQLSLIKWLAKTRPIHITFLIDKWVIEGMVRYGKRYDTFEDALSGYVNNIWQDLTEQERTEIAEILRG